jgi:glycine oxidase
LSSSAIIVGQGLAGTLLGFALVRRGWDIHIVDDGHVQSSSMVAGGLWNPVSFRTMGKTWNADAFVPALDRTYRALERQLGASFYHPAPLVRVFGTPLEANTWDEHSETTLAGWTDSAHPLPEGAVAPHGHGTVRNAGWIDVPVLLRQARKYWETGGKLISERFDHGQFSVGQSEVRYRSLRADRIILCTGWRNAEIPLFAWLPVVPNKGEVLTIRDELLPEEAIINFGQFILPTGQHVHRLGATFDVKATDASPTEEARSFLLSRLTRTFPGHRPEVIGHHAGFRPTVPDRKPLIGTHPEHPNCHCFNGFGSRGVMTIPGLAEQFAGFLDGDGTIPPEANCARYAEASETKVRV